MIISGVTLKNLIVHDSGNLVPLYVTSGLVLNFDAGNTLSYPGSGTTWTDTASNKTATLGSGVTYSSSNGGVMAFTALGGATISGFTSLSNNFTVECWYSSSDNHPSLFNAGTIGSVGFMMGYYSGASPANSWKTTKYGVVDIYIGSIPQNTNWHQVTYTYSSTAGVAVYVDGVQSGSTYTGTGYTSNLSTSTTDIIGHGENGYHNGSIGSFRMWNTVLSSTQVAQNFSAVRSKYGV
jgi:hypothetical protein